MENQIKVGDTVQFTTWVGKVDSTGVVTSVFTTKDNKEFCRINVDGKSFLKLTKSVKHVS
jgi:hypothetical protein